MDNHEIKLTKIPLGKFVSVLSGLYSQGVEFIDIIGIVGEDEDYVGISINREYLSEEIRQKFDSAADEEDFLSKLNDNQFDDDLNDLV